MPERPAFAALISPFKQNIHGKIKTNKRAKMALYRSPDYQINWPFGSGEELQKYISKIAAMAPSWISDWKDFSFFYLQVTLMLPTKFGVSWPFISGEEAKNRFLRWQPWRPSWTSNQNEFSYFDLLVNLMLPFKTIGLLF